MVKIMNVTAALSLAAAGLFAYLYQAAGGESLLTAAITCGTVGYHFGVRLLAGALCGLPCISYDPARGWYRLRPWEAALYERWRVKSWKSRLPTYAPESFSPRLHSWEEIARTMCQAETVHELNCLLSFLPLAAVRWLGDLPVFLITSVLAAGFDLLFVIVQRYNRSRVLRLADRQKRLHK